MEANAALNPSNTDPCTYVLARGLPCLAQAVAVCHLSLLVTKIKLFDA